jgi:hypothetical protein
MMLARALCVRRVGRDRLGSPRIPHIATPRGRRAGTATLVVLYAAAWALTSLVFKTTPSDLDLYFWPSAETVAGGHPLLIYSAYGHDIYPNANGPLGLVPLIPVVALANALGWAGNIGARSALAGAVVSLFVMLLACQVVRLVGQGRGVVEWRLATACTVLLAPALWVGVIDYGHVEQPIELCFVLLGAGWALRGRSALAGVAVGAAVLTRTIAAFSVIPVALVPLALRLPRRSAATLAACGVTVVAGIGPFLIADGPAVTHSLLTYRGSLPVGGGSFWFVARQTGWAGVAQHGDVVIAAVAGAALMAITLRRNITVAFTPAGLFGLLTVTSACFPLFAKTVFDYYLVEPYIFGVVWWLARPGSALNWRALVPVLLTADVLFSRLGEVVSTDWLIAEGVTSSVIIAVVVAMVTTDLRRSPRHAAAGISFRAPEVRPEASVSDNQVL